MTARDRQYPGPLRVLIVEDEPRLREIIARTIAASDAVIWQARSGEEAIKLTASELPDIAILDLNLPGMSGIELFEQLRRRDSRMRVIVLTGFGDLNAARQAIHLDVTDFLTKPCPLGELEQSFDRCRRWLRRADFGGSDAELLTPDESPEAATSLQTLERRHILATLERHNGNRTTTAAELGISRRTLQYRLSEYIQNGYLKE